MQFVELNHQHIAYRDVGPRAAPAVLLAHPLGMNQAVWDDVTTRLSDGFRLVSWDLPGHGASGPVTADISAANLANQALALLDALGIRRSHFVGTSIGGIVGQALVLHAPARLDHVVLTNTGAVIGAPESWRQRAARVRTSGLSALARELVERWFGPSFKTAQPATIHGWEHQLSRCDDDSYAQLCELLAETDFRGRFKGVRAHVAILVGADDQAILPATIEALAKELPYATCTTLQDVGHVPSVEAPAAFTEWLRSELMAEHDTAPPTYDEGLAVRKQVLGDAHVEQATQRVTTLDIPFQDMITRLAWGELWGNPDLSWCERSLITLAVLAALGRDGELELHLATAKRTGVSEAQLRQTLMHVAVYAGVPAANHAFKLAKEHGWGTQASARS